MDSSFLVLFPTSLGSWEPWASRFLLSGLFPGMGEAPLPPGLGGWVAEPAATGAQDPRTPQPWV